MNTKNLPLIVLLAFLYYTTGTLSIELFSSNKIITCTLFAPEGFALAFALYFGKKVIPGIFLGQFLLAFFQHISFLASIEIGLINSFEALIAIFLFKKFKLSKKLITFKDIIGLTLLILFVLQPISAFLSNSILLFHNQISLNYFENALFFWWFGNIMGQLLITPFLLLFLENYKQFNYKELLLYGILYTFYIYILEIVLTINNAFMLMSLSVAVIIFVVAYKNIFYGSLFSIIATSISFYSIYTKSGAFASGSVINNTIDFNLYILSHIIIVWIFGILFEERRQYERTLQAKIDAEVQKNKEQQLLMLQQNRLAQQGELISMIAHQWRQPLNNLSLLSQLIVSKYNKNKLDKTAIEYFKTNSKKQIDLMSRTIDDFRNFFKDEELKKEFSLNAVVQDTLEMIKPITQKNGIELSFQAEEELKVLGFVNNFSQVLLNIFNNAKDVLVEKGLEEKKIMVNLYEENNTIFLSIEDNAGGIPKEILDKIFDPYFSTKKEKNGTGLGLYMSKIIIQDQMHGKLFAKNTQNGAKFVIEIQGNKDDK